MKYFFIFLILVSSVSASTNLDNDYSLMTQEEVDSLSYEEIVSLVDLQTGPINSYHANNAFNRVYHVTNLRQVSFNEYLPYDIVFTITIPYSDFYIIQENEGFPNWGGVWQILIYTSQELNYDGYIIQTFDYQASLVEEEVINNILSLRLLTSLTI